MKVVINRGEVKEEVKFPKLYQDVDTPVIVLFTSVFCGTVVAGDEEGNYSVGEFDTDWQSCFDTRYWTPFDGTITLSNN